MKQLLQYVLFTLVVLQLPVTLLAQQDPQLSLYMFDKMAINPAAAGSKDAMEATLASRDQWLDIPGAPLTNALMLEAPFSSQKTGWGVEFLNDRSGPISSNSIQGNYAYHLPLFKGQLSMGLGLGVYNYIIDYTQVDYKDNSDLYSAYNRSQKIVPTADAGLYYYSNSFYTGLSFNHLIESRLTKESYSNSAAFRPHIYYTLGQGFQVSPNFLFNPSLVLKLAQNSPSTADLNLDVLLQQKLWLGIGFRTKYGFMFMVAYKALDMLQIGYTYDLGLNTIGVIGGGTHEISVTVDFGKHKATHTSQRYL